MTITLTAYVQNAPFKWGGGGALWFVSVWVVRCASVNSIKTVAILYCIPILLKLWKQWKSYKKSSQHLAAFQTVNQGLSYEKSNNLKIRSQLMFHNQCFCNVLYRLFEEVVFSFQPHAPIAAQCLLQTWKTESLSWTWLVFIWNLTWGLMILTGVLTQELFVSTWDSIKQF